MDSEAELMQRLQRGDDEALRALYDTLGRNVHALALRMMGSREDAEEVVQDVFVTVHDAARRFDPARGSARAWVYTVARNTCRMRLRARGSRPVKAEGHDPHDTASRLRAPAHEAASTDRLTVQQAFEGLSCDEARLPRPRTGPRAKRTRPARRSLRRSGVPLVHGSRRSGPGRTRLRAGGNAA